MSNTRIVLLVAVVIVIASGVFLSQGLPAQTVISQNASSSFSSTSRPPSSSSVSASANIQPVQSDLSVTLDSNLLRVPANSYVTFTVKLKNAGTSAINSASVLLLRNDMTYVSATVACTVQSTDSTYVRCTSGAIPVNGSTLILVTMKTSSAFTCIDSTMGRSIFAFIGATSPVNVDLYPQNNKSNILNILPKCN